MNLNESHSYVWFIERFFGICYLSNHKNRLKITNKPLIVGLTLILAVIFGAFTTQFEPEDQASYGSTTSILFITLVFGILSQFWNCIIILISSLNQRQRVLRFYKKLDNLDMTLQNKFDIQFDYKKLKNHNLRDLLIVSVVFSIVSIVINYLYIINVTYVVLTLVFTFTNGSEIISSYDYCYCTNLLKYRFKALNRYLFNSIETSNVSPYKLEEMIKCHFILSSLIQDLNQMYGLKKLLSITNYFILLLSQFYSLFTSIEENFNSYSHLFMWFTDGSVSSRQDGNYK